MKMPKIAASRVGKGLAAAMAFLLGAAPLFAAPEESLERGIVLSVYSAQQENEAKDSIGAFADALRQAGISTSWRLMKARNPYNFARQLRDLADSGQKVRRLVIHGVGGTGCGKIVQNESLWALEGLNKAFTANASIVFKDCAIREEDGGAEFLGGLALSLLGAGGTITAPAWETISKTTGAGMIAWQRLEVSASGEAVTVTVKVPSAASSIAMR